MLDMYSFFEMTMLHVVIPDGNVFSSFCFVSVRGDLDCRGIGNIERSGALSDAREKVG